jgi:uncharacterized repeat protein (TIGR01451 family)
MRKVYFITGLAVVCAGLASWSALAQSGGKKSTDSITPLPAPSIRVNSAEAAPPELPVSPTLPPVSAQGSVPAMPRTATPARMPKLDPPGTVATPYGGQQLTFENGKNNVVYRQDQAVNLEWVGPQSTKVGKPGDYSLIVRNICAAVVQQVKVRVRVPEGMTSASTEPHAGVDGNQLTWDLGTLTPKEEKTLRMRLTAEVKGDLSPQAWVTFTGSTAMSIKVREPKLVVRAAVPDKLLVGETVNLSFTVSNPGDGPTEMVKLRTQLSDGLQHAPGNNLDFSVGTLAPGESRTVQVACVTRAVGAHKCEAFVEAEDGLKVKELMNVYVVAPRLDVHISGPSLRYLQRKATYTLKVANPGDAPAANVSVSDVLPAGFKFVSASDGGVHNPATHNVTWQIGELGANQTREVHVEVIAADAGEQKHKVAATGAHGLRSENELATRIEATSALLLEVADTEDPIEVGAETTYEIRITNTGTKPETEIRLMCLVPDKMQFKGATGPVGHRIDGQGVAFEPLPKLAPKADVAFRVSVKALAAGDMRFKAVLTSTTLVEPVYAVEATRVYADTPVNK